MLSTKTRVLLKSTFVAAAMIASVIPLAAQAVPIDIDSEIQMFGTYSPVGGTTLDVATGLDFSSPALIAAGVNDFAFAVGGNATYSAFDFDPASTGTIFTFASGGEFSASSITIEARSATALALTLVGVYSLDGFDDTPGLLTLTADALGGLFSFSASGTVIPEPTTALLLGLGLVGLGSVRARSRFVD